MSCCLYVCQFGLKISLTTRPIAFPFIVNLLIGPRKVYNCFWGGYIHPPKINLPGKKILSSLTSKKNTVSFENFYDWMYVHMYVKKNNIK